MSTAAHIWDDGDQGEPACERGAAAERTRHRAPPATDPLRRLCRGCEDRQSALSERHAAGRWARAAIRGALSAEDGRKAAEIACLNALSTANAYLGGLDKITGVAKLGVYIATEGDFRDHPKVADGASELLVKVFGAGMLSSRIVLGVASLPLGMPIEIELVFEIA
jgi:enamine deaminase RidA (YjgF/YER057c/UK114 family)